ncbi:cobyrinate a,c-diamide synthase [Paracoccus contaminans]|nr:cobyrinate a,c-diamide synthase [Paracoccus contaminans]
MADGPAPAAAPGLMIAAPASGCGKTTVMLGLLAALRARGISVQSFKNGPDYIDPAFHAAATGRVSPNLDSWAMGAGRIARLIAGAEPADLILAEGSMGLFDGVAQAGAAGTGATADIAALTGWPVVLVLDAGGQAQTAGAVALGLARFRTDVSVAGVIVNRVASARHLALARAGIEAAGLPVLGALPRQGVKLPERHLGLVQAAELPRLGALLDELGRFVAQHCDLEAIIAAARPPLCGTQGMAGAAGGRAGSATAPAAAAGGTGGAPSAAARQAAPHPGAGPRSAAAPRPEARPVAAMDPAPIPAPAERIALARDEAFSFLYPHVLAAWRAQGATVLPFSPLMDEPPDPSAGACWLPGGYPELHAGRLAACGRFLAGLRRFADTRPVHGECGGYMVLGAGLVAADGTRHAMAGLLGLETSFAARRMHLGYRLARAIGPAPFAAARGHEFHYAAILSQPDPALAHVTDAAGAAVPETGSFRIQPGGGASTGSFFHLIAPAEDA